MNLRTASLWCYWFVQWVIHIAAIYIIVVELTDDYQEMAVFFLFTINAAINVYFVATRWEADEKEHMEQTPSDKVGAFAGAFLIGLMWWLYPLIWVGIVSFLIYDKFADNKKHSPLPDQPTA